MKKTNFKVGDKVKYVSEKGTEKGIVFCVKTNPTNYPLIVGLECGRMESFTRDGAYALGKEQSLFLIEDDDINYKTKLYNKELELENAIRFIGDISNANKDLKEELIKLKQESERDTGFYYNGLDIASNGESLSSITIIGDTSLTSELGGEVLSSNDYTYTHEIVFINSFGESFTKYDLDNNISYWVSKENLSLHSNNVVSVECCNESEFSSEIFKSKETANKWMKQYEAKQLLDGYVFERENDCFRELKLDEIYCKAKNKINLVNIEKSIPNELVSYFFDKSIRFPYIIFFKDSIFNANKPKGVKVSQDAFIRIANNYKK